MERDVKKLSESIFDVLIIGGGINGAAIANLSAYYGLKAALIEKNDFASGTSSKSTKLVHGGLRYLENFEFQLVRESLKERYIQIQNAPYLVKPLTFIIPVYKNDRRPLWQMKFGVFLYDLLSGKYLINKRQSLTVEEIIQRAPGINQNGLLGGVLYFDAQMDDVRLCLENVLSAAHLTACVANYIEAKDLIVENSKVVGVKALDVLSGKEIEIRAKKIVSAVGPWTNEFSRKEAGHNQDKIRTTKGVHYVYQGKISADAFLFSFRDSKRIFFAIPFRGNTLIGTTDTDYVGQPDDVTVEEQDIDSLFNELKKLFPNKGFTKEKIIDSFAGLRPLVYQQGSPSKVSRQHVIEESPSGVIYVYGGKYTTYRSMALEVVEKLTGRKSNRKENALPLYGQGDLSDKIKELAKVCGVSNSTLEYLLDHYGSRVYDVLKIVQNDPQMGHKICLCSEAIGAQAHYAFKVEMAQTIEDVYFRRLSLQYNYCESKNCMVKIKEIFQKWKTEEK